MIVPAILTNSKNEFVEMLNVCKEFTDFVQIDIMDGKFVPSKSVDKSELKGLKTPLRCEAHLMVNNPLEWLSIFEELKAERIIFHFEIKEDKKVIIKEIRKKGFKVGLAVNPDTPIEDFKEFINNVDMILFMSVIPGFYGSKFIPPVLDKVKAFKKLYPYKKTGIDGGIKISNVRKVKEAGLDYIYVGSAILKAVSPFKTYMDFIKEINE